MNARKRYERRGASLLVRFQRGWTSREIEDLLARLVDAFDAPVPEMRRVIKELSVVRPGEVIVGCSRPSLEALKGATDEQVARWQQRLREFFERMLDVRSASPKTGELPRLVVSAALWVGKSRYTDEGLAVEIRDPYNFLLAKMVMLAHRVDRQRLMRCDCGRLFLRIGKRRFCSETCQKRVYMRRFRAGDVGGE